MNTSETSRSVTGSRGAWTALKQSYSGLYHSTYNAICGVHPNLRPWHFQWLWVKDLYRDLRGHLRQMRGRVLDVGCGAKPYKDWFGGSVTLVGIDISSSPAADYVVGPGEPWPLESASFDGVLCTQVLEHAISLDLTLSEIARVLKPGGKLVVTAPFVYPEHFGDAEQRHDYRRFTVGGLRQLLSDRYEISEAKTEGRVGAILGGAWLNWLDAQISGSRRTAALKGVLLPLWLAVSGITNAIGCILDSIDWSRKFYCNVFIAGTRRYDGSPR